MTLPTRNIASLSVSAVGLGCMNICHAYGNIPTEAESIHLLNSALDMGCTFFDTAALYGSGRSEQLLGKAIMHRRDEFTLASKCVLCIVDGERILDGRPETIAQTLETSLSNLGVDYIDLYYLHRPDPKVPIEDMVGALVLAKEAGKIGHIGLSEMSSDDIRRAHAVHPISAVQTEYSPMVRNPEIAVIDTCSELGIGFVPFSPVMRGLLANRLTSANYEKGDLRALFPRFQEPNWTANQPIVQEFNALAADLGVTPAQLSLCWVLAKGPNFVPIPGTTSIAHLKEDLEAANMSISKDTIAEVDRICDRSRIAGGRYPAAIQAQVGTETFADELLE